MEDERTFNPVPDNTNQGVVRYLRDAPPAHYSLKVESFSKLVDGGDEKYESATFDANGYTWRLVLYPNGNARRGGGGHISLYLVIEETDSLPLGWEAYVTYKMFVFDRNKDQYLTIQDDPVHQIRRFHQAKKERGFDRLISLETFNDATNGYLIDDSCIFGVEVFEVKNTGIGETIKIIDDPVEATFDWKICEFSGIRREKVHPQSLASEKFTCGESKCLLLYPNGDSRIKDHMSLFLRLVESPPSWKKVFAEFSLLWKNQIFSWDRQSTSEKRWFIRTNPTNHFSTWGVISFMSLSELAREGNGFIVDDTIELQAKVKIMTEVSSFS
ncbi:MATH domain and coiled-coil domain-containing protein At3g58210-like [Daucus carota subsp. sativus]|uniref:MATH domain and coiled-coil domain-containing protein At3g58210-like n=1 Tax=Daucus carota subsp. sativus TaxID=79200 RepID=UPI0030835C06